MFSTKASVSLNEALYPWQQSNLQNGQIESHRRVLKGENKAKDWVLIYFKDFTMLADYTRRYREYTGPTPHSVAIVS